MASADHGAKEGQTPDYASVLFRVILDNGQPARHPLTRPAPAGENAGAVHPLPQGGEGKGGQGALSRIRRDRTLASPAPACLVSQKLPHEFANRAHELLGGKLLSLCRQMAAQVCLEGAARENGLDLANRVIVLEGEHGMIDDFGLPAAIGHKCNTARFNELRHGR